MALQLKRIWGVFRICWIQYDEATLGRDCRIKSQLKIKSHVTWILGTEVELATICLPSLACIMCPYIYGYVPRLSIMLYCSNLPILMLILQALWLRYYLSKKLQIITVSSFPIFHFLLISVALLPCLSFQYHFKWKWWQQISLSSLITKGKFAILYICCNFVVFCFPRHSSRL